MCHGIVRMHMRGSTRMHSRGSRGWQPWHSRGSRGSSSACMHMRGSTSSSAWRDAEEDTPSMCVVRDERYKLRIFHHALRRTLQACAMEKLTKGQQTS